MSPALGAAPTRHIFATRHEFFPRPFFWTRRCSSTDLPDEDVAHGRVVVVAGFACILFPPRHKARHALGHLDALLLVVGCWMWVVGCCN